MSNVWIQLKARALQPSSKQESNSRSIGAGSGAATCWQRLYSWPFFSQSCMALFYSVINTGSHTQLPSYHPSHCTKNRRHNKSPGLFSPDPRTNARQRNVQPSNLPSDPSRSPSPHRRAQSGSIQPRRDSHPAIHTSAIICI